MTDDPYASVGGGLKLKGAKIAKPKKKKKAKTDLEKNLSGGEGTVARKGSEDANKDKDRDAEEDGDQLVSFKTESERRHEERKRKRLLELSESSSSRPELLKTHKERVEELNTYLSKLSEHHDMPKIGPG